MDLFKNTNAALKFAFNYSSQQYALSPVAKMMKTGIVGSGKGLVSLDGAAQAGIIKAEVDRLPPAYRACVIARFSGKHEDCACCGGKKMLDEYKEALAGLDKVVLDRGWVTGLTHRKMRHAIIRAFYEKTVKVKAEAEEIKVPLRTAYDQKAKIWKPLKELDADAQAMIGDGLQALFEFARGARGVKLTTVETHIQSVEQPAAGDLLVCPSCNGEKEHRGIAFFNTGEDSSGHKQAAVAIECQLCAGAGKVTQMVAQRHAVGRKHREDRIALNESLYEAAKRLGVRPAELSACEHGFRDLPKKAQKTQ